MCITMATAIKLMLLIKIRQQIAVYYTNQFKVVFLFNNNLLHIVNILIQIFL